MNYEAFKDIAHVVRERIAQEVQTRCGCTVELQEMDARVCHLKFTYATGTPIDVIIDSFPREGIPQFSIWHQTYVRNPDKSHPMDPTEGYDIEAMAARVMQYVEHMRWILRELHGESEGPPLQGREKPVIFDVAYKILREADAVVVMATPVAGEFRYVGTYYKPKFTLVENSNWLISPTNEPHLPSFVFDPRQTVNLTPKGIHMQALNGDLVSMAPLVLKEVLPK